MVHSIRRQLRAAAHLCHWAERQGLPVALFDERALERFKNHLSKCKCPRRRGGKSRDALRGAALFLVHLRERGIVTALPVDSAPGFGEASERFGSWLARHRGLKAVTIRGYQRYLCPFLLWRSAKIPRRTGPLASVTS